METFFDTRKIKPTKEKTQKKQRRNLNALISGHAITEETVYEKIVDYKQQSKGKSKQKTQLEDSQKPTKNNDKRKRKKTKIILSGLKSLHQKLAVFTCMYQTVN